MSGKEIPICPPSAASPAAARRGSSISGASCTMARGPLRRQAKRAPFRQGGMVLLLSDAPRPFAAVARRWRLWRGPTAYDGGVTSGDATRAMIAEWQGRPLLHIGPERDNGLFEGFDVAFAAAQVAEVMVCSGLFDDTKETAADYAELFGGLIARGVPMICANPDIMVERGDQADLLRRGAGRRLCGHRRRSHLCGQTVFAGLSTRLREIALRGPPVANDKVLASATDRNRLAGRLRCRSTSVFIASAIRAPAASVPTMLPQFFRSRPSRRSPHSPPWPAVRLMVSTTLPIVALLEPAMCVGGLG